MGADLYIDLVFTPNFEKWKGLFDEAVANRNASEHGSADYKIWQKKVSEYYEQLYGAGYFRDPYNPSSVLWQYGLSWWNDVIPMLDERSDLSVVKAETLLEMLQERERLFEEKLAKFPANERQYFLDRSTELQMFLGMAIKLDCSIHCSL